MKTTAALLALALSLSVQAQHWLQVLNRAPADQRGIVVHVELSPVPLLPLQGTVGSDGKRLLGNLKQKIETLRVAGNRHGLSARPRTNAKLQRPLAVVRVAGDGLLAGRRWGGPRNNAGKRRSRHSRSN